jgi:hypothetical protein
MLEVKHAGSANATAEKPTLQASTILEAVTQDRAAAEVENGGMGLSNIRSTKLGTPCKDAATLQRTATIKTMALAA